MKKLLLFISCLAFFGTQAQNNIFTGAMSTSWNNPNNWSLVAVPAIGAQVNIPTGKTVVLDVNTNISSIHLEGTAVLVIQANLMIGITHESNTAPLSTISWGSGNIGGGGTLNILGLLDIIPGGKQIVGGTTVNLSGTMIQDTDWNIDIIDGRFYNMPDGEIQLHNAQRNIVGTGAGNHLFYNYGSIRKLGAGTSTISANLHNFGTISVESGSMIISGTETELTNGTYNTRVGTSLLFGGTQTISGTLTGSNLGEIHWAGTMNVPTTAEFNFDGNGLFNWGNGRLIGGGMLNNPGLLSMTGAFFGNKSIEGGTRLNNTGTIKIMTDWSLDIKDGILNNLPSGVLDFNISQMQVLGSGTGSHFINNSGLIKKTLGGGNTSINAVLNNVGTISVEAGSITLNNAGTTLVGGIYNTLPGCYIFNNQQVTCSGTLIGNLQGNFNWTSDINVPVAATFNFSGSGINNWAAGIIKGGGTLTNEGIFEFSPGWVGNRSISESTTLLNNNLIKITSDQAITMNGGTINNSPGAIIDILSSGSIVAGSGTNIINNAGLLKKSASTGTHGIGTNINNTGIIQADVGTMQFGSLNNSITGVVKGTAAVYVPSGSSFTNNGTFAPGGEPGTLTFLGDYTSNANTKLHVQLYGMTAGTQFDTMLIQNNAIMAGTVVPELFFDPAVGSSFIIANTWGTISSCNLANTATAIYDGRQYTFNVGCLDDNKVVLTLAQRTLANEELTAWEKQVSISPNPAENFILITNNSGMILNEGLISDSSGRIIQTLKPGSKRIELNGYAAGLYFLKLTSAKGSVVKRFIVK